MVMDNVKPEDAEEVMAKINKKLAKLKEISRTLLDLEKDWGFQSTIHSLSVIEKRVCSRLIMDYYNVVLTCAEYIDRLDDKKLVYNDLDCEARVLESDPESGYYALWHDTQGAQTNLYVLENAYERDVRSIRIYDQRQLHNDDRCNEPSDFMGVLRHGEVPYRDQDRITQVAFVLDVLEEPDGVIGNFRRVDIALVNLYFLNRFIEDDCYE